MSDPSTKLRTAKDSLVASLFELSKAANQTASSIIDYHNAIGENDDKSEALKALGEALKSLTSSASQIHVSVDELSVGDDKKPQKKRAEKDPNAPKKPLTVFFAYSAYIREQIRADRNSAGLPPLSSTEMTQEISRKWAELSDDEKEKWKEAYTEELDHYQVEKKKYLEAKANGTVKEVVGPNPAPIPIPAYLQKEKKRSSDDDGEKKKKKKKEKKKSKEHHE